MNEYGRISGILRPVDGDLFHFAPVPLIFHHVGIPDLDGFNQRLAALARANFDEEVLEVPDRRHIDDLGSAPEMRESTWSESQIPAVGIWHRVPTNDLLANADPDVEALRSIIVERYLFALSRTESLGPVETLDPAITESWIQFYKDGDDKVLHNHARYGPPYPRHQWAGAYYLDDGEPDDSMPYAGAFSFRVRETNYLVRPQPGLLMLWPAEILHEVHAFYGKRERIVVNFNINAGLPPA